MILVRRALQKVAQRAVRLLESCSKSVTLAVFAAPVRRLFGSTFRGSWFRNTAPHASFEAGVLLALAAGILRARPWTLCFFHFKNTRVSQTECVLVFVPGGRLVVFVASRPTPPNTRCAAWSQARHRPCCAVQRCDAGRRAPKRRVARCGIFRGLFRQQPACLVPVCRSRSVGSCGKPTTHARRRQFFPNFDRTDRLVAWGSQTPEQACPNEVR